MSLRSENFGIFRRIVNQPVSWAAATMGAALWAGAVFMVASERLANAENIERDAANLARVFEENVIRSVSEVDKTLKFLRQRQQTEHSGMGWPQLIRETFATSELTLQIAVIDANGRLVATDREENPRLIQLGDREHFRVHAESGSDRLFVSKPVLGRVSKQWSVQMTRRLVDKDGNFGGVVVASLDPSHFSRFYDSISLGRGGMVALVGHDGIVRASGGELAPAIGNALAWPDLAERLANRPEGTARVPGTGTSERILAFRTVRGMPLSVIVGADEEQEDSAWLRNRRIYMGSAAAGSIVVALFAVFALRRSLRLDEARREVAAKSKQLRLTLENIAQGVIMVDAGGTVGFMSRRCAQILELPEELTRPGVTYRAVVAHLEATADFASVSDPNVLRAIHLPGVGDLVARYERARPDGTLIEVRTVLLPDGGFVRTLTDITEQRSAEAKIVHLARHDPLTELANRIVFRQQLDAMCEARGNGKVAPFAVHLVDLDEFKAVNDTYGHGVGDDLLKQVADRLRQAVRGSDVVARLGGDEFAVIQAGCPDAGAAAALADRLCRSLARPYSLNGNDLLIGASIGIALAPEDGCTAKDLVHAADIALYAVKSAGRGTYLRFEAEMDARRKARLSMEADLRAAINQQQFELHYQPIVSCANGRVTAYEALVRWRHPERGNIAPLDFIPLAEETGLIVPLGNWIMRTACKDVAGLCTQARVAVNLSPLQFRDRNLVASVEAALRESGLPPSRLEIEITESALLQNDALTQDNLTQLRAMGVNMAMDDFGTGYSSLGYLLTYPIHSIKIDRSFVDGVGTKSTSTAIVRVITSLASALGLTTTAEGVETADQLRALRELGCDEVQGYLLGRPQPLSAGKVMALSREQRQQFFSADAPSPERTETAA